MCCARTSASMSWRRSTAPRRRVRHRGKERDRHKARSYLTVQSVACSELLAAPGKDRPEKNASSGNPDKDPPGQQGREESEDGGSRMENGKAKTFNAPLNPLFSILIQETRRHGLPAPQFSRMKADGQKQDE